MAAMRPVVTITAAACSAPVFVQADEIKLRMAEKRMMVKAKTIESSLTQSQYVDIEREREFPIIPCKSFPFPSSSSLTRSRLGP